MLVYLFVCSVLCVCETHDEDIQSISLPVAYCYHSEGDKDETDPQDQTEDQTDRCV